MAGQPNKPGGDLDREHAARPVEDRQAVRNQSEVKPEDYPDRDLATPAPKD
jgi:hypothetical protein